LDRRVAETRRHGDALADALGRLQRLLGTTRR
jgi:hypothetical protein